MEFTQADLDRARAEGKAEGLAQGKAEGEKAGLAKGAAAERARIKSIVESPEAKGREGLAAHYAYATEDTVATAEAALKASAKASGLDARAAATEKGLHTAGTDNDRKAPVIDAAAIYSARRKAVG